MLPVHYFTERSKQFHEADCIFVAVLQTMKLRPGRVRHHSKVMLKSAHTQPQPLPPSGPVKGSEDPQWALGGWEAGVTTAALVWGFTAELPLKCRRANPRPRFLISGSCSLYLHTPVVTPKFKQADRVD